MCCVGIIIFENELILPYVEPIKSTWVLLPPFWPLIKPKSFILNKKKSMLTLLVILRERCLQLFLQNMKLGFLLEFVFIKVHIITQSIIMKKNTIFHPRPTYSTLFTLENLISIFYD